VTSTVAAATEVGGVTASPDFEQFFDDVWPDLIAFCTQATGSAHLGEELCQEALTRVYVRYPLLREPRPYVFRVAANLVKRSWREHSRDLPDVPAGTSAAPDLSTLDAVRRLPEPLRDVVLLHYWADLPIADVARLVRRPQGTVKRRLHEARAQLAVTLGRDLDA
jgi:RNA polymerase sigma-70 factor (ECF subfamily)